MSYTRDSQHELYVSLCVTYVVLLLTEHFAVRQDLRFTVMNFRLD